MTERVPSFFMLVPGPWREPAQLVSVLTARGIVADVAQTSPIRPNETRVAIVEDDALAAAFAWGRGGAQRAELVDRVGACSRAALVECALRLNEAPREIARVGRALRDAGGVCVRMEASGSASAWEPWLASLESGDPTQLYACAAQPVDDGDGVYFTCGMHHFDLPYAQIALPDATAALAWLEAFSVFQIAEKPA
jgi:hypothetical protein